MLTGLVATNLLSACLHVWAIMQWSWFQDDWLYVQRAASWPLVDYLLMNYNGHAMPLKFLLVWILTAVAPLEFAPAGAVLALLIITSAVCWTALLVRIFGLKVQVLFVVTALILSPLFISPTLWWAAGIQTYSMQLGMALAIWGALAYVRSQRRSMYWLSLGAYIMAVLAWEKALLIAIPVAFVVVLLPGIDRSLRSTWQRMRRIVLGYVIAGSVLVVVFLWITRTPVAGQADLSIPPVGMLLSFAFTAGVGLTIPALVGGPWAGIPGLTSVYPAIPMFWEWLFAAATSVVIAWGVVFRRGGWAAVAMAATYGVVSWGLVVGSSRYESLGEYAALDPRYSADVAAVVILAVTYLITSTVDESKAGTAWRYRIPRAVPRSAQVGLGLGTALVTVSSLATWSSMMTGLIPLSPRPWVDNLTSSARDIGRATVFNSNAPINVLYPYYYPDEGRLNAMLAPLDLPLSFDEPAETYYAANADGAIVPARIDPRAVSVPGGIEDCGYLVSSSPWTFIPMDSQLYAWNWGLRLSYYSNESPVFEVRVADDSFTVEVPAGVGDVDSVIVSRVDVVAIRTLNGATACVPSVNVGLVEPAQQ